MLVRVAGAFTRNVIFVAICAGSALPASALAEIPLQEGDWPQLFEQYIEPIPYDVDGDGALELIVNTHLDGITIYRHDGSIYSTLPMPPESTYVREVVAAGDLQRDGVVDMVAIATGSGGERLVVWDGEGQCRYASCSVLLERQSVWMRAGPTLYDLDLDGDLEIIIPWIALGSHHLRLVVFEVKGEVIRKRWQRTLKIDENLSTVTDPAVGDIDGDGKPEIVFGSTGTWLEDGGLLFAFRHSGKPVRHWPIELAEGLEHPPVLADLTGDGRQEIINNGYGSLDVIDHRGRLVWTGNGRGRTPVVADIDGDGLPEVLTQAKAYDHDGTWTGWTYGAANPNGLSVGDIDSDGDMELLFGGCGSEGLLAFHHDGTPVDGFPLYVDPDLRHTYMTPVLADLDGDGDLEITITGAYLAVWDLPGEYDPARIEWPMYQRDAGRGGQYRPSWSLVGADLLELLVSWGLRP
jgi:hypothetical protein